MEDSGEEKEEIYFWVSLDGEDFSYVSIPSFFIIYFPTFFIFFILFKISISTSCWAYIEMNYPMPMMEPPIINTTRPDKIMCLGLMMLTPLIREAIVRR